MTKTPSAFLISLESAVHRMPTLVRHTYSGLQSASSIGDQQRQEHSTMRRSRPVSSGGESSKHANRTSLAQGASNDSEDGASKKNSNHAVVHSPITMAVRCGAGHTIDFMHSQRCCGWGAPSCESSPASSESTSAGAQQSLHVARSGVVDPKHVVATVISRDSEQQHGAGPANANSKVYAAKRIRNMVGNFGFNERSLKLETTQRQISAFEKCVCTSLRKRLSKRIAVSLPASAGRQH